MSIKKTWFSYILWLMATGFSVCFFYTNACGLSSCLGFYGATTYVGKMLYGAVFLLLAVTICYGCCLLRRNMKVPVISKWGSRGIHIGILLLLVTAFVITRMQEAGTVVYDSQTVFHLYESSKIGAGVEHVSASISVLDKMYRGLLSGVFLFLGNKVEAMLFVQIILQTGSLLLLIYIGFSILKDFFVWIPAAGYALSPLFSNAVTQMGAANFWFFLVLCLIGITCLLKRFWKNAENITCMTVNGIGLIAAVILFFSKIESFAYGSYSIRASEGLFTMDKPAYFVGAVVLALFLLLYCVSFWFSDREYVSLYIIPEFLFVGLLVLVQSQEAEMENLLLMLIHFYLYFVVAQGLFLYFSINSIKESDSMQYGEVSRSEISKRDTALIAEINSEAKEKHHEVEVEIKEEPTEKNIEKTQQPKENRKEEKTKPSNFEWWDKDNRMEEKSMISEEVISTKPIVLNTVSEPEYEEENVLIRVSDIVKDASAHKTASVELPNQTDSSSNMNTVVDKTAMIENVLPMPKKHVNRTLDYAFEPSADQMCYDIEVSADDDYDYTDV